MKDAVDIEWNWKRGMKWCALKCAFLFCIYEGSIEEMKFDYRYEFILN
jgi:hypothetical protein